MKKFYMIIALLLSFNIATVTNAASFQVASDGEVGAYFLGGSASHTTYLSTVIDDITRFEGFNNQTAPIGKYIAFGEHLAGDLVEFVLYNHTTGYNYSSITDNNPDLLNHIKYLAVTLPDGTSAILLGFEDLYGLGDSDFNDSIALFTNVSVVPEPSQYILFLLGLTLFGYLTHARKAQ